MFQIVSHQVRVLKERSVVPQMQKEYHLQYEDFYEHPLFRHLTNIQLFKDRH